MVTLTLALPLPPTPTPYPYPYPYPLPLPLPLPLTPNPRCFYGAVHNATRSLRRVVALDPEHLLSHLLLAKV